MTKKEFAKKVLNSFSNTVFTTEDQVLNAIEVFEKLGMLPPERKATVEDFANTGFTEDFLFDHDFTVNKWD